MQLLVNRGGAVFADATAARMGDQSATTPERKADGGENQDLAQAEMPRRGPRRLRGSGHVAQPGAGGRRGAARLPQRRKRPSRAMPPELFAGSDGDFGWFAVPVHADGDQVIDFVVPQHHDGPDTRYGTEDDFTTLVTLLNTTPLVPFAAPTRRTDRRPRREPCRTGRWRRTAG